MTTNTITPNAMKNLRKGLKEMFKDCREDIRKVRELRATGRYLDQEDAQGILEFLVHHKHEQIRILIRKIKSLRVEKYSNLSTNAAARENIRRGN